MVCAVVPMIPIFSGCGQTLAYLSWAASRRLMCWHKSRKTICNERGKAGKKENDKSFATPLSSNTKSRDIHTLRHWILTGRHGAALPHALRAENFAAIRANLDCLEWRCQSLESFLDETGDGSIDRYNLSDIFEYMSPAGYHRALGSLVRCGRDNSRLAYWNLLAARRRPSSMAGRLQPLGDLARRLHAQDKAFFYSAFVLEEKP